MKTHESKFPTSCIWFGLAIAISLPKRLCGLLLIEMLRCLGGFRPIQAESAKLAAARMPLLEVFIGEFLRLVENIVKRGLRSDYTLRQDNLFALGGKLLVSQNLNQNLCRADRFFTEHDEFSTRLDRIITSTMPGSWKPPATLISRPPSWALKALSSVAVSVCAGKRSTP